MNRRSFLKTVAVAGGALWLDGCRQTGTRQDPQAVVAPSGDPLTTFDPGLYLLVDDEWVDRRQHLERVVNQPQPLDEPVIAPDDPLTESEAAWGNVIREPDGKFRMWYSTLMLGHRGGGHHEMAKAGVWGRGDDYSFHPRSAADVRETEAALGKYAESEDGIHWTKPKLGLIEFRGNRRNNIVLNGQAAARQTGGALTNFDGYTIVRDDDEVDTGKRYKMIAHWESIHCHDNKSVSGSLGRSERRIKEHLAARGKYMTFSPDGIRWDESLRRISFPDGRGDRFLVVRDHRHDRWFGYSRAGGHSAAAFSYSTNLEDWSAPTIETLVTSEALQAPKVECLVPFNYGNQDLGVPVGMDKDRNDTQGARAMVPFLAAHHDGKPWQFVGDRTPLLPAGPPGTYYATGAVPLHNEPFIVGDELLLYFNAFSRYQEPPCPFGTRTIGVAKLRRDGFAGLEHRAAQSVGTLRTRSVNLTGTRLDVNVAPGPEGGRVEVALLDRDNNPLRGFDFTSAVPIEEDSVRAPVRWRGGADLGRLEGREVRIAFRLRGTIRLYAFAIGGGKQPVS